jgi:hypothetical protein
MLDAGILMPSALMPMPCDDFHLATNGDLNFVSEPCLRNCKIFLPKKFSAQ